MSVEIIKKTIQEISSLYDFEYDKKYNWLRVKYKGFEIGRITKELLIDIFADRFFKNIINQIDKLDK